MFLEGSVGTFVLLMTLRNWYIVPFSMPDDGLYSKLPVPEQMIIGLKSTQCQCSNLHKAPQLSTTGTTP